jgi:hypothetical protein
VPRANPSDLISSPTSTKHDIETPFGEMSVWVRDLSWVERQNALTQFVHIKTDEDGNATPVIDFGGYWKFVLVNCIERTEPELSKNDLLNIRPEVGDVLATILPSFDSMMTGLTGGSGPLA